VQYYYKILTFPNTLSSTLLNFSLGCNSVMVQQELK